mmetsp:Transcript_18071/g.30834  ORF Transcript_18071/g.30834 Transcript_18071/m.30834 type:complete len:164 (-) Transcript_18071:267-758(-)
MSYAQPEDLIQQQLRSLKTIEGFSFPEYEVKIKEAQKKLRRMSQSDESKEVAELRQVYDPERFLVAQFQTSTKDDSPEGLKKFLESSIKGQLKNEYDTVPLKARYEHIKKFNADELYISVGKRNNSLNMGYLVLFTDSKSERESGISKVYDGISPSLQPPSPD